jgi:hypothetical protein
MGATQIDYCAVESVRCSRLEGVINNTDRRTSVRKNFWQVRSVSASTTGLMAHWAVSAISYAVQGRYKENCSLGFLTGSYKAIA